MVRQIFEEDPSGLKDWLYSKCPKAVRSLKDTVTALNEVLIIGKSYCLILKDINNDIKYPLKKLHL